MDKLNLSTAGFAVWIASLVFATQLGSRIIDFKSGFLELAVETVITLFGAFAGLFLARAFFPKKEDADD
mgnify:FL=1